MERGSESIDAAVARTITDSALAGERIVAVARLVFVLLVFVRSIVFWDVSTDAVERAGIAYPPQAVAIAFSIAVLCGLGRRRTMLVLHVSVALDVVIGFLVLLPNAVLPGPGYRGTPYMIDTAALLMLVVAAGLRQSATAVGLSGGLALLALGGLAFADAVYANIDSPSFGFGYTFYALLVAAVATLSLVIAVRTRRLVERATRAALIANKAEQGLRAVLHGHHDLRTVITSAQINADLLSRNAAHDHTVDHLREDLGELRAQLDQVKRRALEELAVLAAPEAVAVDAVLREVTTALAPRFPAVAIRIESGPSPQVMVAGGAATLRRIVANLVVNACEGDGARGASSVDIHVREGEPGRMALEIADDGPGLPSAAFGTSSSGVPSTKASGSGIGIPLVQGLVRASGGTVSWSARDGGGTRVLVELAAAEPR